MYLPNMTQLVILCLQLQFNNLTTNWANQYYVLQVLGDVPKAKAALAFYRRNPAIDDEMSKLDHDVKAAKALADKPFTVRELFGKKYRRPFFIAVFLQVN